MKKLVMFFIMFVCTNVQATSEVLFVTEQDSVVIIPAGIYNSKYTKIQNGLAYTQGSVLLKEESFFEQKDFLFREKIISSKLVFTGTNNKKETSIQYTQWKSLWVWIFVFSALFIGLGGFYFQYSQKSTEKSFSNIIWGIIFSIITLPTMYYFLLFETPNLYILLLMLFFCWIITLVVSFISIFIVRRYVLKINYYLYVFTLILGSTSVFLFFESAWFLILVFLLILLGMFIGYALKRIENRSVI